MSGAAGMAAGLAGVLAAGGAGALASRNAEVIRKWRTWAASAPLVAGLLWLGAPGAVLLAAGLGAVGAVEYGRLARLRTADYWFRGGVRPAICRALCAAFPVRRSGGGSADLAAAGLRAGAQQHWRGRFRDYGGCGT
jgi:hypothetical protein